MMKTVFFLSLVILPFVSSLPSAQALEMGVMQCNLPRSGPDHRLQVTIVRSKGFKATVSRTSIAGTRKQSYTVRFVPMDPRLTGGAEEYIGRDFLLTVCPTCTPVNGRMSGHLKAAFRDGTKFDEKMACSRLR